MRVRRRIFLAAVLAALPVSALAARRAPSRQAPVSPRLLTPAPVSFLNDVLPALTLAGCNQGACHGGQFGRGGLKLSLLGFDPESDYIAIAREGSGRRLSRTAPERSLLLTKPTLALPHGGGLRLPPGSGTRAILEQWVAQGAPGPVSGEATAARIEVSPTERLLGRGERLPLRVIAVYPDGRRRDVTRLARYTSVNDAVAAVEPGPGGAPLVRSGAPGDASITVLFQEHAAAARFLSPYPQGTRVPLPPEEAREGAGIVDRRLRREWRRMGLLPSPPCTDAEFLRRASLDLTGALPTAEEAERFLSECAGETRPGAARARLIDRLLERPEWADYWALYLGDLLRNTQRGSGEKGMWAFAEWLRTSLREGKPYHEMVRELVAGSGSTARNGAANFYNAAKTPEELAETTSQVFLGVRLQCAKCHNHPFERWTQADYYGLAAFFPGIRRKESGEERLILHGNGGEVRHPRTGAVVAPTPPRGAALTVPGEERPAALAAWLADPANPFVARNIVNRVWARIMGRGLIEPVDDIRVSNPPSHPELLDALCSDFAAHQFDLKRLMRTIATSHAYGLSSKPAAGNARDDRFYARYRARRLGAEPLLDALGTATGRPEKFAGLPASFRAISLPDPAMARSALLDLFGRPARATACECERSNAPTMTQTLYLINSTYVHDRIADPNGLVAKLMEAGKSDSDIIRRLYLGSLSRPPTLEEAATAARFVQEAGQEGAPTSRREGLEDVLWTLLNSQEFLLNH
ncbi:MAG: DUF1553 domain-containing protein [Armatimonadetes bacterium]|nr:DUF1553 domain-containing protein [Armatimonadota bacterium]